MNVSNLVMEKIIWVGFFMPLVRVMQTLFLLRAKINFFRLFHVNHMADFRMQVGPANLGWKSSELIEPSHEHCESLGCVSCLNSYKHQRKPHHSCLGKLNPV